MFTTGWGHDFPKRAQKSQWLNRLNYSNDKFDKNSKYDSYLLLTQSRKIVTDQTDHRILFTHICCASLDVKPDLN